MKVTLVYPGIARIGFNSLGRNDMDCSWVGLGLAYIGSYLKLHHHHVDLIDLRALRSWADAEEELRKRDSDICGVHFNTVNFTFGMKCAEIAKKYGKIVVAGGPHATINPTELISTGFVDYVIKGEGEISFLNLVKEIEGGKVPKKIIEGIKAEDIDTMPLPDRDLYDIERILRAPGTFPFIDNGLVVLASRGCPYRCNFCQPIQKNTFGTKVRKRSVRGVISEVKEIQERYKPRYMSFQDDIFTINKDWTLELCEAISKENFHIQWSALSRVDTLDEELARALGKAGCKCLFFGFESGSQRMLDFIKKDIKVEESLRAAKLCRKHGILIFANYLLGLPTETEADLECTYRLIRDIKPEISSPSYFSPIPGSELYEYCKDRDLIEARAHEDFIRFPEGEKIRGVDYALVKEYKEKILKETMPWWRELYYIRLVLKRWLRLFKGGHAKVALNEFLFSMPLFRSILKIYANLKNGFKKADQ